MNLVELSIKRPVFAWVLMFSLIVFGAICMNRMGVSQMPDVNFPILNINVNYDGAAPEIVEADLLDPIEQRLLAIEGIKEMRSSARQGSGSVTLEFDISRNIDVALQEVQSALTQLRLPVGVDPPVIRKQNPEEDPILILSIYGEADLKEMLNWADTYLLDQLRFLPGVGEVGIGGFSERNLRIWIDKKKLEEFDLTISDVIDAVRTQHVESAAGQFTELGKRELRVRWLGEGSDANDVGEIRILRRGGQVIYDRVFKIKDVALVEDGLSDIRRMARVDGKQALAIQVRKQRGTNEVDVAQSVSKKIEELSKNFPPNYKHRVNIDFTKSTESTVDLSIEKLWVAGLVTILVCYLFLGSLSAAVNILFSIPTSIVGTFIIIYFSGFTLNLFTLLALTLSISIVVDDAIMLLENIVRHYRMGKGSYRAALEGSLEVLPAATAATLAVIAVFLPVVFMDGVIGKFFFQFGITMSAAVLLSLLEAVTITPMRAAAFLSGEPKMGRFEQRLETWFHKLEGAYARILEPTLQRKWLVLGGSAAFFLISLYVFKFVRREFVPAQDQNVIILQGQSPPGTSLEATSEKVKEVEAILAKNPLVEGYFVSVGAGGPSSQVNAFFIPLVLKDREKRKASHQEVMNQLREAFKEVKGLRISMRDISARNLTAGRLNPVAFNIRGPDLKVLEEKSLEMMKRLEEQKLAVDLDSDYRTGIPELLVEPDREAMALRNVSVESVGQVLAAGVGGLREGRYTANGRRYDIRFKILNHQIQKPDDVKNIMVRNMSGNMIPLGQLVKVSENSALQGISRINRQRAISVFGNLAPGQSQAAVLEEINRMSSELLPSGYTMALEGASAGFADSFKSLSVALLVGILVAYLILAVQFNSFSQPIPVLMALPFSVSGALVSLWIFDVSLNLFSFIGLIVLMGIAKKNSILLVEFTNHIRSSENKSVWESLTKACPVRLRPILMTSVATVAAALPLILGNAIGSETRVPMGLTVVGGTILSTLLTLFVVPAMYLAIEARSDKKFKKAL